MIFLYYHFKKIIRVFVLFVNISSLTIYNVSVLNDYSVKRFSSGFMLGLVGSYYYSYWYKHGEAC